MSNSIAEQAETPLDPARPIVDPHQHFWDLRGRVGADAVLQLFLLPELLATIESSGHNITHTVYAECGSMYRQDGPDELKPIGETEFVNGIAAMSASGRYGSRRIAAGIVGSIDLRRGDAVAPLLDAHIAAGNGRFRGIRTHTAWVDGELWGRKPDPALRGIMADAGFRTGVRALGRRGLVLDLWCLHPQLAELTELAAACPDTVIVLDHLGTPLDFGPFAVRSAAAFDEWRTGIRALARLPNVCVKLGGMGMSLTDPLCVRVASPPSTELAARWRPRVETCIEAFGADRCMFESNFPPDVSTCSYGALWNAFKRISAAASEAEKSALFSGTAARVYRLIDVAVRRPTDPNPPAG
jgi:L-fuconolactonase